MWYPVGDVGIRGDGVLRVTVTYDAESRIQHIDVRFDASDGRTFDLVDPYDRTRAPHSGVMRYLYPIAELDSLLADSGFVVEEIPHETESYYMLKGEVPGKT